MSRPIKYRRNRYLFRFPSKIVYGKEDIVVMGADEFCKECRKPLNWLQKRTGAKYCSHKCANRANGRKAKGTKRKPRVDLMSMR